MKKIGLLNFHYSNNNYGAVLQAAALENYIKLNFHKETEHINFIPTPKKKSIRIILGDFLRLLRIKKKIYSSVTDNNGIFESFRSKWITRSEIINDHNKINSDDYWLVIVGSDQVWRPIMTTPHELVYFLSFCSDSCKRASYAASFGVDNWPYDKKTTSNIKQELNRFSAISCREISGVKLCNDIFSKKADLVLDPTLLIGPDFFDLIIKDETSQLPINKNEIVYYKLDINEKFINQIDSLSEELNVPSCNIYYTLDKQKPNFYSVSSWLSKIKNCKIVITDSFHCVCFAILYQKPFLFYPNEGRGLSRLESLLSLVGLTELICYDGEIQNKKIAFSIDYNKVNSQLELLRKQSHQYLSELINHND